MVGKFRHTTTAGLAFLILAATPPLARADIGWGLLGFTDTVMGLGFIPIVVIEAVVVRRLTQAFWWRAGLASIAANLVSTGVGVVMARVFHDVWGQRVHYWVLDLPGIDQSFGVGMDSFVPDLRMFLTALPAVMLPCYLLSVWIERFPLRWILREASPDSVRRSTWIANSLSYAILVVGLWGFVLLGRRMS